nr:Ig mu chain D region (E7) - mouse [Mus musculus]
RPFYGKG